MCEFSRIDVKNFVLSNVIPLALKITEHKLNGSNYSDWRRTILFYLWSTDMDNHMTDNPPEDAKKKQIGFVTALVCIFRSKIPLRVM